MRQGNKLSFTLAALFLLITAGNSYSPPDVYPADCPTKMQFGINVTTRDCYSNANATSQAHYYLVNLTSGNVNANFDRGRIAATISSLQIESAAVYPILSMPRYIRNDSYLQPECADISNESTCNYTLVEIYRPMYDLKLGARTTNIRTQTARDNLVEIVAPFSKPFSWNGTIGSFGFDPDAGCEANLNTANTVYTMSANCTVNLIPIQAAFNITATNVTLDCAGFTITGNNSTGTYGIYSTAANTTIQNCNISNFDRGIYLKVATGSLIQNNTINGTYKYGTGVFMDGGQRILVTGNNIDVAWGAGIAFRYITGIPYLSNATNNVVTVRNGDSATYDGAIVLLCGGCTVSGNNLTTLGSASGYATLFVLGSFGDNNITNNRINNTKWSVAVRIQATTSKNILVNNIISSSNAGYGGIFIYGSSNTNATNNTITSSTYGILGNSGSNNFIDCQGSSIIGTNASSTYGIYTDQSNTTIKNCNISNFQDAIQFNGASNGTAANNTLATTRTGGFPLNLLSSARNNRLINNTLTSNIGGLVSIAATSGNNTFFWNNFTNTSGYYVNDTNGTNYYNTSNETIAQGNVWADVINGTVPITSIYSYPTPIAGYFYGSAGSGYPYNNTTAQAGRIFGNVTDYGAFTPYSYVACGVLSTPNYNHILNQSIASNGSTCLNITAASISVNCSSFSITGDNTTSTFGITSNSTNTTITACNISSFQHGIFFSSATNGTVRNNTITISRTDGDTISLNGSSTGSNISNNTFISAHSILVAIASASGANTFYHNNFTNSSTLYVNDANGSNFYNTTIAGVGQGNYWFNVLNRTIKIYDINGNTWGDAGEGYPYNNYTSGGKFYGIGNDSAPYAPFNNSAPNITATAAYSDPTLSCTANITDDEQLNGTGIGEWYADGLNQTSLAFIFNWSANTSQIFSNISSGLIAGEWNCRLNATDAIASSGWTNSNNASITFPAAEGGGGGAAGGYYIDCNRITVPSERQKCIPCANASSTQEYLTCVASQPAAPLLSLPEVGDAFAPFDRFMRASFFSLPIAGILAGLLLIVSLNSKDKEGEPTFAGVVGMLGVVAVLFQYGGVIF